MTAVVPLPSSSTPLSVSPSLAMVAEVNGRCPNWGRSDKGRWSLTTFFCRLRFLGRFRFCRGGLGLDEDEWSSSFWLSSSRACVIPSNSDNDGPPSPCDTVASEVATGTPAVWCLGAGCWLCCCRSFFFAPELKFCFAAGLRIMEAVADTGGTLFVFRACSRPWRAVRPALSSSSLSDASEER